MRLIKMIELVFCIIGIGLLMGSFAVSNNNLLFLIFMIGSVLLFELLYTVSVVFKKEDLFVTKQQPQVKQQTPQPNPQFAQNFAQVPQTNYGEFPRFRQHKQPIQPTFHGAYREEEQVYEEQPVYAPQPPQPTMPPRPVYRQPVPQQQPQQQQTRSNPYQAPTINYVPNEPNLPRKPAFLMEEEREQYQSQEEAEDILEQEEANRQVQPTETEQELPQKVPVQQQQPPQGYDPSMINCEICGKPCQGVFGLATHKRIKHGVRK